MRKNLWFERVKKVVKFEKVKMFMRNEKILGVNEGGRRNERNEQSCRMEGRYIKHKAKRQIADEEMKEAQSIWVNRLMAAV